MNEEIRTVLEGNEKIIWEGRQDLKSAVLSGVRTIIFLLVFVTIIYFATTQSTTCKVNGEVRPASECAQASKYVMYGLIIIMILVPFSKFRNYKTTEYVITNNRIIIKTGWMGTAIQSIYYDTIKGMSVIVGLIDKLIGTGTIKINTGEVIQTNDRTQIAYKHISNIKNPYEVYRIIQDNITDQKESSYPERAGYKY